MPAMIYISGTIESRSVNEINFDNFENLGSDAIAARECIKYSNTNAYAGAFVWIDKETGIVMKRQTDTYYEDGTSSMCSCLVTELSYGTVKESDVAVDLSEFKITE